MVKLDSVLSENFKIIIRGSEEEKEINELIKQTSNLLSNLSVGEQYSEGWKSFDKLKSEFKIKLVNYNGQFLDYFNKKVNEITNEEKHALGYNLGFEY